MKIPLEKLEEIAQKFGTPFHLYDEKTISGRVEKFKSAFSKFPGFREFFAVKATPTPAILKIFSDAGFGMDCSSLTELILCEKCGISGEKIMFSSNGTKIEEFQKAVELGAIVNLDDISLVDHLVEAVGTAKFPELICFRFNPGVAKSGNSIIGNPVEAKYGITPEQILPAYEKCKKLGAKRFGIHAMVASNERDEDYFVETAGILAEQVLRLREAGFELEFMNIGGGFGIPYEPGQSELDLEKISDGISGVLIEKFGSVESAPKLFTECGRWFTGPAGWLVSRVNSKKEIYKKYIVLDSCMADLMRPALYGAYHRISVPARENGDREIVDVVGSLCENNDKFAIDREIPKTEIGDLVVIHDAGAHGRAMGFNYNGKLRTQEILLRANGIPELIRRKEAVDDYFSTLIF